MTINFYKNGEMNGRPYVKFPLRSDSILNDENNDQHCFIWSRLAHFHPCNNNHPNRVSNYGLYLDECNIQDFDFTNGFKCSDFQKTEKLNNLSINKFELNFYQDQNKERHKKILTEVSKNESDRVNHLLIYKNHYVPLTELNVFLGNHFCKYVCRHCLTSYTSQYVLIKQGQQCGERDVTSLRLSNESHIFWMKHVKKIHYILQYTQILKLILILKVLV